MRVCYFFGFYFFFFFRDVPSMGIYLLAYEHFCCMLKKLWEQHTEIKTEEMPKFIQVVGGGLAGTSYHL